MNKKLLTPLFVAASFLLIGCSASEIISRPSWIEESIINVEGIENNKMKEIYDAIKKLGDTNANVLNKVMYDVAKGQLGTFEELAKFQKQDLTQDLTEFNAFVEKHKLYQPDAQSAVKVGDQIVVKELADLSDLEKSTISRDKIQQQYIAIVERASELMYNEVKGGSYYSDGIKKLFSEKEYVRHLRKELYYPDDKSVELYKDKVFLPKPINGSWEELVNQYIHLTDGNGNFTKVYYPVDIDVDPHHDGGYIGRKILPDVYREALVEHYVREQRSTNLGRSYARKVNMIKIEGGDNVGKIQTMLINYAKKHITGDGTAAGKATPAINGLDGLNAAMIGIADANDSVTPDSPRYYLESGKFDTINFPGTNNPIIWKTRVNAKGGPVTTDDKAVTTYVYHGTKLGNIVETFMKAFDLKEKEKVAGEANFDFKLKTPITEEVKTAYNDLTNNTAYPIEIGLELKERELFSNDLTQDGWYLKNGGLSDLTEQFRNDLFNISTSGIIDDSTKMTISTEEGSIGWGTYKSGDTARYFQIGDTKHSYLLGSAVEKPEESVVLQDSSNNFFIVEIEEASSMAKLSLGDDRSYIRLKADEDVTHSNKAMNGIVRNIAKQVASGDTYKKNAEQYYLMISNILFYDQSVYDYFKSQFPDLFK